MEQLRLTRSTLYRYLKILADSGLITSFPGRGLRVGSADRRAGLQDAQPRSADHREPAGDERARRRDSRYRAALPALSRHSAVRASGTRRHSLVSTYERGLARPLFQGRRSRIILAYLPPRVIERLHQQDRRTAYRWLGVAAGAEGDAAARLGSDRESRSRAGSPGSQRRYSTIADACSAASA